MSGGLAALLDDVATIAKMAAASVDDVSAAAGKASAKAAAVVVDDTAVTPRYVQGFSPERELPIIKRIALGSLRNKLIFILPALLLLSQFAPWALTPLLMAGGAYLCFEGAEKIWESLSGHHSGEEEPAAARGPGYEESMVSGAIRTDFILSAEIMVISLNEVAAEPLASRATILVIVGLGITALVYGVVALIVKMDDIGLALTRRGGPGARRLGHIMVAAMPGLLRVLAIIGTVAMLWVGGHILLAGLSELGWAGPYEFVHHAEEAAAAAVPFGHGAAGWLTSTFFSALSGLLAGAIIVAIMHLLPRRHAGGNGGSPAGDREHDGHGPRAQAAPGARDARNPPGAQAASGT